MRKINQKNRGYALYTAIILTGILILVAYITADISIKQLLLSVSGADSHIAFYNADAGLECALYGDLKNANGTQSIFDQGGTLSCNNQSFPITPSSGGGGGGPSTITFIGHAVAQCQGACTATTPGINTTGATLLVAKLSNLSGSAISGISDSNANTWHHLNNYSADSGTSVAIWYAYDKSGAPLAVGSGHTVTVIGGSFAALSVEAFSGTLTGADPFDQQSGASCNGASTCQTGSITPSADNALIVSAWAGNGISPSVNSGMTLTDTTAYGQYQGGSQAYIIQTSATAINPTWSYANSPVSNVAVASFKAGVSGGGGSSSTNTFQLNFSQGCAVVTVTKTGGTLIESHGYNSCSGSKRLERGIKIQY